MTSRGTIPCDQNLCSHNQDWDPHPANMCSSQDRSYEGSVMRYVQMCILRACAHSHAIKNIHLQ